MEHQRRVALAVLIPLVALVALSGFGPAVMAAPNFEPPPAPTPPPAPEPPWSGRISSHGAGFFAHADHKRPEFTFVEEEDWLVSSLGAEEIGHAILQGLRVSCVVFS